MESALVGHAGVAEAAVVGASDEHTGQAICAFVILKAHRDMEPQAMVDELRAEVAKEISPSRNPVRSTWCPNCRDPQRQDHAAPTSATSPKPNSATSTLLDPTVFRRSAPKNEG